MPSIDIPPGLGRGRGVHVLDDAADSGTTNKRARKTHDDRSPTYHSSPEYAPHPQRSPSFSHPQQDSFSQQIDPQLSQQLPPPPPPVSPPLPQQQHGATTTETLLQTEVYNSHEALLTLIEAAGKDTPLDSEEMKRESRSPSTDRGDDLVRDTRDASCSHSIHNSPAHIPPARWNQSVQFASMLDSDSIAGGSNNNSYSSSHPRRKSISHASPKTHGTPRNHQHRPLNANDEGTEKALKAWNKFRFVKAGWFSAREAISYVEYFNNHLHPLSPTLTNPTLLYVSHRHHHHLLLRNEPFLATAILTVASRYLILPVPGGQSRSFAIHDMLWREVRGAFERLMWGGGWGGLGVPRPVGISGLSTVSSARVGKASKGLRTIGTVEGLLILTEWHVRGLHFPMDAEESDWGIALSDDEDAPTPKAGSGPGVVEGLGDKIENILEPAYRSDRMSWMLLGNALALAYELGVFDESDINASTHAPSPSSNHQSEMPFRLRSKRIQKLLLVYVLQLASRLGWTSMIPRGVRDSVRHKRVPTTPPTTSADGASWTDPDELQDAVFSTWVDLTMLMNSSSELLFPSRSITKQIMRSGQYVALLEHFQPLLRNWKNEFESLNLPAPIYHILVLEYEHVRFYINSLALQAVVDRCSQVTNPSSSSPEAGRGAAFSALWEMSSQDLEFIREVVDASRSLLTTVVHQMFPNGYLKHAPVRIYLRILSAAMFLLKTFALGAKEVEVKESMELIGLVCDCLRNAAVDDVHLGLRFADLLGGLAGRIQQRFVRMHRQSRQGSPVPAPQHVPSTEETDHLHTDGNMLRFTRDDGGYGYTQTAYPSITLQQNTDVSNDDVAQSNTYELSSHTSGSWGWGSEDWLALPLDPILGFEGVTQGTMGVDVGGMDLLEVLLAPANS